MQVRAIRVCQLAVEKDVPDALQTRLLTRDLPPTVEPEKNDTPGNRAQHRRQVTDETPSRAVGFCVGWQPKPLQKAPSVGSGAKFGPSTCTFGLAASGLSKAANRPTQHRAARLVAQAGHRKSPPKRD